ncbi:imidazole glycerol phosphate synthase subunit HisH [Chloroflexota bacterium]
MYNKIVIIDYSAGNLRSVVNAVKHLSYQPEVTSEPAKVRGADAVILPGVGAAADTMANLKRLELVEPIHEVINRGTPFLGVCIGLQVLFAHTDEGGEHRCLGVVPGRVRRLPEGLKVPHMGWNQVRQVNPHAVFDGIPDNTNFYFVHSYYGQPEDSAVVAGVTDYSVEFCSVLVKDNLVATQFHPEKSGEMGLRFYENFFKSNLD